MNTRRVQGSAPKILSKRWSFEGTDAERLRYRILVGFLVVCAIGGGASRPDVFSLLYVRPAAIICLASILSVPGPWKFDRLGAPLVMLTGFAAVILLQLVPIPPDIWLALPGRSRYAEAAAAGGFAQPWRPLSLTP